MRIVKPIIALATWLLTTSTLQAADSKLEFFEKQIRPLLVNHCYQCHGPEEASGKLRLDTKAGWTRGGERGPVIVPGDPSASLLIQAVKHEDKELRMPPLDAEKQLTAQQIKHLETWIRQGAVDPRQGEAVATAIEKEAATH
ncbi:MAG: c-type cytochrome domain-containing protein, partial [Pirellulaceae bacterium]